MVFSSGDLCCASAACVLLDISSTSAESWDLIPDATNVGFTQTANDVSLVTSSSGGEEKSACGTVTTTGTLFLACHNGGSPGLLCINEIYRIRWSHDCDLIWDVGGPAAVATPDADDYFEARIRITSVPITYDISGNAPIVFSYTWKLVEWISKPACQVTSGDF